MSRKIAPKTSVHITEEEAAARKTDHAKLLFTTYRGRECALTIQDNRLWEASFFPEMDSFHENPSKIGAVYIGKVKNAVPNLEAYFVEIADRQICFLPLKNAAAPYLLNRRFDGRILEGDELLVQVTRDAQKTKRASVTADISLSNDYFVISSGSTRACYSLKLSTEKKEAISRLFIEKGIVENGCLVQECDVVLSIARQEKMQSADIPSMGFVVRTMAGEWKESIPMEEGLLRSFQELAAQFIRLLSTARYRNCFSCLKEAPGRFETLVRQFIAERDFVIPRAVWTGDNILSETEPITEKTPESGGSFPDSGSPEIITDQKSVYQQLQAYCSLVKVRLYEDSLLPLSKLYSINSKLDEALGRRLWLRSGGYLVIEPTEALTVIDVNSGKYESGRDSEDAYRRINLEAAREVVIQMRLRNLSGIIIVDFINMKSAKDKKALLNYLKLLVKRDRVQTTVVDMTPLGLVEITRKKINKPLQEQFGGSREILIPEGE